MGERYDVAAAIEYAEFHDLPNIWVLGWSFGTDLALMHAGDPAVQGAMLLSPPLRFSDPEHLAAWAESGKPLTALVPEHDDYLQPPEARERFAAVPQAEVVGVDGAKHLWVGDAEKVLDLVVRAGRPGGRRTAADRVGRPDGDRRHQRLRRPHHRGLQGRAAPRPSSRALSASPAGRPHLAHQQGDRGRRRDRQQRPDHPEQRGADQGRDDDDRAGQVDRA